jgi:hypothetical protein
MSLPEEHQSTITKEIIAPFLNLIFFETGAWYGGGLLVAKEAGFQRLYSLELDSEIAQRASENIPEATIFCGDSRYIFGPLINEHIDAPTTFFLDSHKQIEGQPPISTALHELYFISQHSLVNTFTILIDDIRMFKSGVWGTTFEMLITFANRVKRGVKIDYIDNRLFKDDIMVLT